MAKVAKRQRASLDGAGVKATSAERSFHQDLILSRWMLGFFKGESLAAIKSQLADERLEGLAEDGQSLFLHELIRGMYKPERLSESELRKHDFRIIDHWRAITSERNKQEGQPLKLKYFQYISLLFTEIYLDWYFNRRAELLSALNLELSDYLAEVGATKFSAYEEGDLNKIAFWSATGSGKTLLMHVNIRQYLEYFGKFNAGRLPDKIILLTPNEGLSDQHLDDLHKSGFSFAQVFNKSQVPPPGTVEIIDINKLGEVSGDKTVSVDAFEGNNLVLVDEGHRGTGTAAGAWISRRDALVRGGFAFEYSATFGQAVSGGLTVLEAEEDFKKRRSRTLFSTANIRNLNSEQKALLELSHEDRRRARLMATRELYAKCILFDYSYKYFYEDGYGKESVILNMDGRSYERRDDAKKYFTAALLSYYQQLWLWGGNRQRLLEFNIEKPLWVFVGNTVSGEESDILEVVNFLAEFLNDEEGAKACLAELVADRAQLLDAKVNNIFKGRFTPLLHFAETPNELYADILVRLFNANAKQRLKLVNIKSSKGGASFACRRQSPIRTY